MMIVISWKGAVSGYTLYPVCTISPVCCALLPPCTLTLKLHDPAKQKCYMLEWIFIHSFRQFVFFCQMSTWPVCTYQTLMPTWQSCLTSRPSTWASTRMAPSNLITTGRSHTSFTYLSTYLTYFIIYHSIYFLPQCVSIIKSNVQ